MNTLEKNNNSIEDVIKVHKAAAYNLVSAAKNHFEAVKHYEAGEFEKALEFSNKAQEFTIRANDCQKEPLIKPQLDI